MSRIAVGVAIVALHLCGGCSAAAQSGDTVVQAMVDAAQASVERGSAEEVYLALQPAMEPRIFNELSPRRAVEVARLYGYAADRLQEWEEAHTAFVAVTRHPRATGADWHMRMETAAIVRDGPDAYLAYRHLRDQGARPLSSLGSLQLGRLDRLLRALPEPEARLALGRGLEAEAWRPPYVLDDISTVWLHYVEALLEAGDEEAAVRAASRITNPMTIMAMRSDRRFDGVVARIPALQDPEAAAERYLAVARRTAEAQPRLLSAKIAVVMALNILNRPEESLPILAAAHRALAVARHTRPPFDDPELKPALDAWRSSVLLSIGRVEDAIIHREVELDCKCAPAAPTNLARALLVAGRAVEAQEWLAAATTMGLGPTERMDRAQISACAAAGAGDKDKLREELKFLRVNEDWMPEAHVNALVCADRLDEAEAVLIRLLDKPSSRLAALSLLQTYADGPVAPSRLKDRWAVLKARPNLRNAAEKVGRLENHRLRFWGSV